MDKDMIVNTYCLRDINTDPLITIINALKKLNYYNLDYTNDSKKYIIHYLINELSNNDKLLDNLLLDNFQIFKTIYNKNVYESYNNIFLNKIKRAIELSKYLIKPNLYNFYSDLSYDELEYLGY